MNTVFRKSILPIALSLWRDLCPGCHEYWNESGGEFVANGVMQRGLATIVQLMDGTGHLLEIARQLFCY